MSSFVQIQASLSLDGFMAGPGDDMDWIFKHAAAEGSADVMTATGAILAGRRTYDVGRRSSRIQTNEPYGGGWSGAQFVLTHRPPADDPDVTFLSGDVTKAVQVGLAAAGGKNLALFGGDVGAQCLARGLVDEILVFVLPVLLGAGIPLFRDGAQPGVRLEQLSSRILGCSTRLQYRVVR